MQFKEHRFREHPNCVPLGNESQGVLKTKGNDPICCLQTVLIGVGSRKPILAKHTWLLWLLLSKGPLL